MRHVARVLDDVQRPAEPARSPPRRGRAGRSGRGGPTAAWPGSRCARGRGPASCRVPISPLIVRLTCGTRARAIVYALEGREPLRRLARARGRSRRTPSARSAPRCARWAAARTGSPSRAARPASGSARRRAPRRSRAAPGARRARSRSGRRGSRRASARPAPGGSSQVRPSSAVNQAANVAASSRATGSDSPSPGRSGTTTRWRSASRATTGAQIAPPHSIPPCRRTSGGPSPPSRTAVERRPVEPPLASRQPGEHRRPGAHDRRFPSTTGIVCPSTSVGLNSTISAPA